ncbi:TrkH family potassium uptake protein [Gymnodinialimonas ulvae]|uniref:TrkH family potassium uptake protein n=1 Tax=Gymnodinialimonas ulvae TaxID=3126504 RepID=UPI0030AB3670
MKSNSTLGDGADTLRQQIRAGVILLTLAKHAPVFAVLYLPPALWGMAEGEWTLALSLLGPVLIAICTYAAVARRDLPKDLRAAEAMASVALVFLIAAIGSVPAFLTLGFTPVSALFEGMSGLTTTGLSVAQDPDSWPFAAHFMRAWLQWIGGLVMATAVLALILPAGMSTRRLGQAGIDQGDRIASTRAKARQLLVVYVGLTALMTGLTILATPDWREAVALTLSGISTGGFAPRSDSLASYGPVGQAMVILSCVLGAVSLLTFALILKGDWRGAWRIGSARRVGTAIALLGFAFMLAYALSPDARAANDAYGSFLNFVSALTTAGYSTSAMPGGALLVVVLLAMLIGGDAGSTGGGLKLARAGLLFRAFRHAFRAPAMPDRAVAPLRMDGEKVSDQTIIGVLALIFVYVTAMLALLVHFTLHGYPVAQSLFDTVSALSTVGLSSGLVGADLPWDLKVSLTLAMWLGRLEFIAVLVLLWPRNWIRGH